MHCAGVTRGTIFRYFANKAALFNAMCERVRRPMKAMVDEIRARPGDDPLARLRTAYPFAVREIVHDLHTRNVACVESKSSQSY